MAWIYCACGEPFDYPSLTQISNQAVVSPKCGKTNDPRVSLAEWIEYMHERIKALAKSQ